MSSLKHERYSYKTDKRKVVHIPINRLETSFQTEKSLDESKVRENMRKIRHGVSLNPITIGDTYQVFDGHHRLEAAKRIGLTHVPCEVKSIDDEKAKKAFEKYKELYKNESVLFSFEGYLLAKSDTLPIGTEVTWHYRSAIGHGTIAGIAKKGETHATTKYRIREHDHHPGEPAIVEHYGSALSVTRSTKKSMSMIAMKDGRMLVKKS